MAASPSYPSAFEILHERQRDGFGAHVAELYGLKESESLRSLTASVGAAQLLAELDGEVAEIMAGWLEKNTSGVWFLGDRQNGG